MSVSPSAVSRYVHGTLAPSPNSLCRLLMGIEDDIRDKLLIITIGEFWKTLRQALEYIKNEVYLKEAIEYLADEISRLIEKLHR